MILIFYRVFVISCLSELCRPSLVPGAAFLWCV